MTTLSAAVEISQIKESGPSQFQWRIDIPQETKITFGKTGPDFPGWSSTVNEFGYTVPVISKLVYTKSGPPKIEFDSGKLRVENISPAFVNVVEKAKGIEFDAVREEDTSEEELVSLKLIRQDEELQLWAINVIGASVSVRGDQIRIPEHMILTITSDIHSSLHPDTKAIYLNEVDPVLSEQINAMSLEKGLGYGRLKLQIMEDGIYRVSYRSLAALEGFPIESIESHTIKLINKDEEQTIYVADDGDGYFNENDYFDFIGRQNYSANSTQYFDPFSDINIYWLDWG
ncbi:MAG: hypothetical protein K9N35_01945 [Candidatus Marinimicrobia bacterium]|nr:hypothetical protein [Candidatus Neomarinimicrobiota bacterium]